MITNEKRIAKRFDCAVDSFIKNLDATHSASAGRFSEITLDDISERGLRFRSNHFVSVHSKLLFKINLPNNRPIEVLVQPAWIREIPALHQFDIGAKFISLSDSDKKLIQDFTSKFI